MKIIHFFWDNGKERLVEGNTVIPFPKPQPKKKSELEWSNYSTIH